MNSVPLKQRLKLTFLKRYWIELLTLVLGIAVMNAIFISDAFRRGSQIDPTAAGQLGDFVGGYIGTFLSLVGVVLVVATFRGQQRASKQQFFESRYFELLKLHRDNVEESELQGAVGRKLFVLMIREFRCALVIVRDIAAEHKVQLSDRQAFHLAYYCLYFGVGPNSSRMLLVSLPEFNATLVAAIETALNDPKKKRKVKRSRKFTFTPFEGHQSRLGHYYRHLYQMVRYVDDASHLNTEEKYQYAKTIRAQLSTHEQALLFINSLSPLGRNWWKHEYIVRYRMVQNIPREFFNTETEIDLVKHFTSDYFEWQEEFR